MSAKDAVRAREARAREAQKTAQPVKPYVEDSLRVFVEEEETKPKRSSKTRETDGD